MTAEEDKAAKSPAHVKWAKYRKNRKKCVHGKGVYECGTCGGKRMCEHDKQGVSRQCVSLRLRAVSSSLH